MAEQIASSSPGQGVVAVTPADSLLATPVRAIYVGGTGNLKITAMDGSIATFSAVPAGSLLPVSAKQIWTTGTTATLIVGLL